MKSSKEILKNLKKLKNNNFQSLDLSILSDSSTQYLTKFIKAFALENKLNIEIWDAPIDQIEQQIFNKESQFHKNNHDLTIVFESTHSLLKKYNQSNEKNNFSEIQFKRITDYLKKLIAINKDVILFNFYEINDFIFGNYSSLIGDSFIFQLRKLNFLLSDFLKNLDQVRILDVSSIQNSIGSTNLFDSSLYVNYEMVFNIEGNYEISKKIIDVILSKKGFLNKCIIIDLDNTTWGGIIGDDGIDKIEIGDLGIGKAFKEFQQWVKKLKERGIILCVCSKNTEKVAKEVFLKHPEMVLKLDDISVFMANWDSKVNNIKKIQKILNIGFDSMVFIDDNSFERNVVRDNIPGITVPDLPEDPSNYLNFLYSQNLFEVNSYSKSTNDRTDFYKKENERIKFKELSTDLSDYMTKIGMKSRLTNLNSFNIPRVSELSNRSNQFNLRTIRYSQSDLMKIMNSNKYFGFVFDLEDKFGSHGIVSYVIVKSLSDDEVFIENWAMSCRVLERSFEQYIINKILNFFKEKNYNVLLAEYIETKKNLLVKDIYKTLGFSKQKSNNYSISLKNFKKLKTYIKEKKQIK
jgi:FkbH-like protein